MKSIKKIITVLSILFIASSLSAEDPCEGYWLSYHFTKKYLQCAWHTYVAEDGKLYGDTVALTETKVEDAKATGFKGKKIKNYPIEVEGDFADFPTINNPWMINLEKKSEGEWEKGNILDPSTGSIYKCRCIFHPADGKKYKVDTLEVRGEIGLGIGASLFWTKCTEEEALAIQLK